MADGFLRQLADMAWWLAALPLGVVPRRLWAHLEPPFPLRSAAPASGLLTAVAGSVLGIAGFFAHAARGASERNAALLQTIAEGRGSQAEQLVIANYGMSSVVVFEFLFFTPLGLFAIYLTSSGALRALSAWMDEPYGDFVLSGVDRAAITLFRRNRQERTRIARERREGADVPDRLYSGGAMGVDADYVVVSSRRKPEWEAGAIVMTSSEWYRLGVPFDLQMPGGLRTAYPLTKMESVEAVRRGIQYELPRLTRAPKSGMRS